MLGWTIFLLLGVLGISGIVWFCLQKNEDLEDGHLLASVVGVFMLLSDFGYVYHKGFNHGAGYVAPANFLSNGKIYRVDLVIDGVSDGRVLVVRELLSRDLVLGTLNWNKTSLFVEFENMPPTPCFKVINAKEGRYSEVEIQGVDKDLYPRKSE